MPETPEPAIRAPGHEEPNGRAVPPRTGSIRKASRAFLLLSGAVTGSLATATPQLSVYSANDCTACHVRPAGWDNPEPKLRKCTLSCNGCHVNPTGGGLRHEGGIFYGKRIQPLWAKSPVAVRPAHGSASANHPEGGPSNPMDAVGEESAPKPRSPARFDGIQPSRTWQFGVDARIMTFFADLEGTEDDVVGKTRTFPMQSDLHLLFRPRNPGRPNHGRLTLLAKLGAVGQRYRDEDFATKTRESGRVKELFLLFDDLPYQLYVKAGRFYPAFGWMLDDHTPFIRQGQGFDFERWVEGVEVGLNPNYPYAHLSLYRFEPDKFTAPFFSQEDDGHGAALSLGTRHFLWQLGGSVMYERRRLNDDFWAGIQWSINLGRANHPWKRANLAPVVYLGELDWRRTDPVEGGDGRTSLTSFHELDYFLTEGLRLMTRFDWQDFDAGETTSRLRRYTVGAVLNPVPFVELFVQYRHNDGVETGTSFNPGREEEALIQLHLWF